MQRRAALRRALRKGLLDKRQYPLLRALCERALKKYALLAGILLAVCFGMLVALFHVPWPGGGKAFFGEWSRVYIAAAMCCGTWGLVLGQGAASDALALYRLRGVEPAALPKEARWYHKIPIVKAFHCLGAVKGGQPWLRGAAAAVFRQRRGAPPAQVCRVFRAGLDGILPGTGAAFER